jgi:hypothetical protein
MLSSPKTVAGRVAWLTAAVAAMSACVVAIAMIDPAPSQLSKGSDVATVAPSGRMRAAKNASVRVAAAKLAGAVQAANAQSAETYTQQVEAWREYFQAVRDQERLRNFVGELIGLEQNLRRGIGLLDGQASADQRVLALFRQYVVDERKVAAGLQRAVDGYEGFLAEQDREILEAAGISRAQWTTVPKVPTPDSEAWNRAMQPVVARAVSESRRDAARFVANTVVADLVGDGIKSVARKSGLDKSKQGSVADWVTGIFVDVAADVAIDHLTDPTEGIITRLGQEMARSEHELLDGDQGLCVVLHELKSAHETARGKLVAPATGQ